MRKKNLFLLALFVSLFLVGCNDKKNDVTELHPEVTSISIKEFDEYWAINNGNLKLDVNISVKDQASTDVTWSSSNENIATIDDNGLIKPLKEGKVTFTVKSVFDESKTDSGDITFYNKTTPINGGFELDLPVWGVYTNSDNSLSAVDNEVVLSGEKSYKVQNAGNYTVIWHGVDLGVENDFEVGDYIKGSCFVYSPVANQGIKPVLMIEKLDENNNKTIISQTKAEFLNVANEWVKLETPSVRIPEGTVSFNVKVEFHEMGLMYVDNVNTYSTLSNDVSLKSLLIDGNIIENYSNSINSYNYVVDDTTEIPEVAVELSDELASVEYVQATNETLTATVKITAQDNTVREITVQFIVGNINDLVSISVNGKLLSNFNVNRYDYYILLEKGNNYMPQIEYTKANEFAQSSLIMPTQLPGTAQIVLNNETEVIYEIYIDVVSENRLIMGYPDMDFERTTESGLARNWGFDRCEVTNTESHSGNNALVSQAQGGGGWVGMDLAGGDYPKKGDKLIAGVWFYIENAEGVSGDITIEIYGKETQGQIANLVYHTKSDDYGKWVYIETESSTAVGEEAQYVQIVVKNWTNTECYFDDITLKKAE